MTSPNPQDGTVDDGLTDLQGEELIEVVRTTVVELQRMLDRLQRYVGDDDEKGEG